jgi:hypothetical protein
VRRAAPSRERPLSAETFVLVANQLRLSVLANQLMKGKANGDDACTRSLLANCSDRLSHAQTSVPSALAAQRPASELASQSTFAPLAEYRGLLVTRPMERARILIDDAKCRTRPAYTFKLLAKHRAIRRCEVRVAVRRERRRRCVRAAPILPDPGACMRLARPCVFGAVQVAPTPHIRPREVQRYDGSEAHGASKVAASHPQAGTGRIL